MSLVRDVSDYTDMSDEVLFNLAGNFLRTFREANHRNSEPVRAYSSRSFERSSFHGSSCVRACKERGVKIDFARVSTHGWLHTEIFNAESLIAEVIYRMNKRGISFNSDIDRVQCLEAEIVDYIDKFCTPPALNADDLVYNAVENARALRL